MPFFTTYQFLNSATYLLSFRLRSRRVLLSILLVACTVAATHLSIPSPCLFRPQCHRSFFNVNSLALAALFSSKTKLNSKRQTAWKIFLSRLSTVNVLGSKVFLCVFCPVVRRIYLLCVFFEEIVQLFKFLIQLCSLYFYQLQT